MAAAATLPPRAATLVGPGARMGAAATSAEALGLGAALHSRPLGPLSPNPDDWGQYVDDDEPLSSEDDGYASTVSLVRGSQENLSRDVSSQSLDSLCELAAAKQSGL